MFPCRVSWKNYLIFLGKVCIFFEHSILPIMTILLNGAFFVQNKCCAVGGILWNFHVVFRWLSQLHNHGIEHNNANTSRFCGHTKSYLAPPFNEIIWKHLKLSDDFRRILKTSENKWKHLKIFWWLSENKWNYLKLSDDFRHCLKLPHLGRESSVFFSQKKTTRRNVSPGGSGDLRPRLPWLRSTFVGAIHQQSWNESWQILGSKSEKVRKVRLVSLPTEIGKLTN